MLEPVPSESRGMNDIVTEQDNLQFRKGANKALQSGS
jgi:hypothetical protein